LRGSVLSSVRGFCSLNETLLDIMLHIRLFFFFFLNNNK
jgi:hypothetical protein